MLLLEQQKIHKLCDEILFDADKGINLKNKGKKKKTFLFNVTPSGKGIPFGTCPPLIVNLLLGCSIVFGLSFVAIPAPMFFTNFQRLLNGNDFV